MTTKKITDFISTIQDALDQEKQRDPLAHVRSITKELSARTEKRIAVLEANRQAFNTKIDQAIAVEKAAINNLKQQVNRINIPDDIRDAQTSGTATSSSKPTRKRTSTNKKNS